MILAGIQPSAVWFRVLQGMSALACDQFYGGSLTLSLCPTARWHAESCMQGRHRAWGERCWSRVALWDGSTRLYVSSGPALCSGGSFPEQQVMSGYGMGHWKAS